MKKLLVLKGLGAVVLGSVGGAVVDALHQQMQNGAIDQNQLISVAVTSAVIAVLGYFKQSPLKK